MKLWNISFFNAKKTLTLNHNGSDYKVFSKWQLTKSRRRRVWNQTEGLDGIITKWCMASIRRENTRWCVMPYACGDYILTCGEIPYQSFGLDRKKTVRKRSFFCVWSLNWQLYFSEDLATPKWCYASHSDVAHFVRSDVMCSFSHAEGILHARSAHHFQWKHHVPFAEHIVEKSLTRWR